MWKAVWLLWFFFFFTLKASFIDLLIDWLVYLKGRLVVVVLDVLVGSSEQQHSGTTILMKKTPNPQNVTNNIHYTHRAPSHDQHVHYLFVCVLPGCTERRGAVQCFLMHSGNSCQRHRTAGAPSAARCHSDMPELTHMRPHTQAHTHTHTHRVIIVQGLNLPSVQVIFLIVCLCVCHLMDFLPPVLICHPCNHDNKYS